MQASELDTQPKQALHRSHSAGETERVTTTSTGRRTEPKQALRRNSKPRRGLRRLATTSTENVRATAGASVHSGRSSKAEPGSRLRNSSGKEKKILSQRHKNRKNASRHYPSLAYIKSVQIKKVL